MRNILIICIIVIIAFFAVRNVHFFGSPQPTPQIIAPKNPIALPIFSRPPENTWNIQSIDTMKYSRDAARGNAKNVTFASLIDLQMKNIAGTGANYVSIDTPYDQEFVPMLSKWVASARKYNLHVWFRGNWSSWEGWFDYPKNMTRDQHIQKTHDFISSHPDVFADGDIFSACPECENGGSGDPRVTGDVDGFRNFIISESKSSQEAFEKIGKNVSTNYYPMNRDVAQLVMDKKTTAALGGIVVIDHYVKSPEQYAVDIKNLQQTTGGKIVLGEFGAPLPDVHGKMTWDQQAQWIDDVLKNVSSVDGVEGVNYWVNAGGTTSIWDTKGDHSASAAILQKYFKANNAFGIVTDELNNPISGAQILYAKEKAVSRSDGYFEVMFVTTFPLMATVSAPGFTDKQIELTDSLNQSHVVLEKK